MNDSEKASPNIETAFDDIIQYIMRDKYFDILTLSGDNSSYDCDSILQHVTSIKVMTFYLLAEYKQSEKLVGLIGSAINSYIDSPDITISSSELNENIDINLDSVYSDFNKVYKMFCNEASKSVKEKLDINNENNKKCDIIFFLNMLYQFMDDENKELFLTYIPSIIYAFHANYAKKINGYIERFKDKKAKENEISEIIKLLTTIHKDITMYSTREGERKQQISINSFLFVSLYNAIITNYRKNFIVNFLWFERNVGFYQYYLTNAEYSKAVNHISSFESTDSIPKIDISIPTALYLNLKNRIINDNKDLWEILDLIIVNKNVGNDDIYNILTEIFTKSPDASAAFCVDYNSVIGCFNKDTNRETYSLKDRFTTYSVQVLYYYELLTKENFIKNNKYFYSFHCDEISDDDFTLEDVTFNLWYTSDGLSDMFFNIINADDKYYIVYPVLNKAYPIEPELWLNDSIIWVKRAKKICLKGNLIGRKTTTLLKLEKVKFNNLNVEHYEANYDKIIDCFTSKDIVKFFNKINKTDANKIYVFLGLHYFTNIEDYPQGRRNIIALYVNGLMGYQNFFPIRGTLDYNEMPIIISRYLRTLRIYGSSTASGCSTSCSGSGVICTSNNISTNCSTVHGISDEGSTQGNAPINSDGL